MPSAHLRARARLEHVSGRRVHRAALLELRNLLPARRAAKRPAQLAPFPSCAQQHARAACRMPNRRRRRAPAPAAALPRLRATHLHCSSSARSRAASAASPLRSALTAASSARSRVASSSALCRACSVLEVEACAHTGAERMPLRAQALPLGWPAPPGLSSCEGRRWPAAPSQALPVRKTAHCKWSKAAPPAHREPHLPPTCMAASCSSSTPTRPLSAAFSPSSSARSAYSGSTAGLGLVTSHD